MYAIIETGNKQYRVAKGDLIEVELLGKKAGENIKLDKVLLASNGKKVEIGTPYLKNINVNCEVLGEVKSDTKVVSFRYRRRKASKKKIGHRQHLTRLKIKEIKRGHDT